MPPRISTITLPLARRNARPTRAAPIPTTPNTQKSTHYYKKDPGRNPVLVKEQVDAIPDILPDWTNIYGWVHLWADFLSLSYLLSLDLCFPHFLTLSRLEYLLKFLLHQRDMGGALLFIQFQHLRDELCQRRRNGRIQQLQGGKIKRSTGGIVSSKHLIECGSQAIDIGARTGLRLSVLFWGRIAYRIVVHGILGLFLFEV